MSTFETVVRLDAQAIPPQTRHATIFATFAKLGVGQAMELVNSHDPRPLYFQFADQLEGQFAWDYLERGPETFRVAISRVKAGAPAQGSSCCGGGCGGA
ncbi:MAG: DUF2249 domain-containing protein [Burkholderiales bacterium]|nr:DUF2249 domain-containing protein [Burkholderiales bacterium]